jgi:outer membrane receptor protein involved in Fe transport
LFDVPNSSPISFAKLRLGWAQVGNDTDPFRLADPFFLGTPVGSNATAAPSNTLPNFDLKPELQTSYEIGADVRLFNDRIGVELTYDNTISENQILAIDLPESTGKTSRIINAGKIQNRGVELLLNATPIRNSNGLSWNTMFNFSRNRNEVLELPEGVDQYIYGGNGITLVAQEGGALGDMWGTGLRTVDDENSPYFGEVIFRNGLVQQDNTLRPIGNFNPDFNLGWLNELSYKNFSLNFLFDLSQGGDLLSIKRLNADNYGNVVETVGGSDP